MDSATGQLDYYFKRNYSSFDVGNIMRIVGALDKSTQARIFENTQNQERQRKNAIQGYGVTPNIPSDASPISSTMISDFLRV